MGNCCTGPKLDESISKCHSIADLEDYIIFKQHQLPEERKEINENIKDPHNQVTYVDVSQLTNSEKRKRILYLESLERLYGNVARLLSENPDLPFQETQNHINDICAHYLLTYDEEKGYNATFDKFRTFVEKWNEEKNNN